MLPHSLFILLLPYLSFALEMVSHTKRTTNGLHLPLYKRETPPLRRRAGTATGSIGLGDFQDITYNVLVNVGQIETPLVLDTGSSDLWVVSDACKESACNGLPLYPQASFQSAGLDASLFYGDSTTGTHAFGEVGRDIVGVAGLSIRNQFFAAINDTNTTVLQTGSAGIVGMGFPVNSVVWAQLFKSQFPTDSQPPLKRSNLNTPKFPDLPSLLGGSHNKLLMSRDIPYAPDLRRTRFPDLASLLPSHQTSKRQSTTSPSLDDLLNSFATNGPLVSRLAQSALAAPQFTVTLQRDTVQFGGNVGMLSIGELPQGVANQSLTWVPIRGYTPAQGGINSPTDTYPIAWEVPIDGVFLDGQRLPDSTLSPNVAVTALVDTGNSLIRGPQDVVQALLTSVTGSSSATATYDCSVPHTLAFQIGGAMFPIDPRDFLMLPQGGNAKSCQPNVVATDPPHSGFLYSWSLGDPFLKSNLASFYYGNLTHPSADPPRVGFMSTVPSNANDQLSSAVAAAQANGGSFPVKTEAAPQGNPSMATTISGVPQAAAETTVSSSNSGAGTHSSGGRRNVVGSFWGTMLGCVTAVGMRAVL
ncbi:aspartic peptidase domain-containing protein [Gautieria morchelliformis]|nr:aspartic peptidase domain-containing protein [Gautieria morchelliformis]